MRFGMVIGPTSIGWKRCSYATGAPSTVPRPGRGRGSLAADAYHRRRAEREPPELLAAASALGRVVPRGVITADVAGELLDDAVVRPGFLGDDRADRVVRRRDLVEADRG